MIAVTGATGHLGQKVVDQLLKQGEPAQNILAVVRDRAKAEKTLPKGIQIRVADYSSAADMEKALIGADRLLIISGTDFGQRLEQHTNIVRAGKKAGVKLVAYTSIVNADKSGMFLAQEHLATEKAIETSGLPYTFLRNSWYLENYTGQIKSYLDQGVIRGAAGDGRISAASRVDYAAAAAAVLRGKGHENKIYELGGAAFTLKDLAAAVSKVSGKKVEYQNISASDLKQGMLGAGLPPPMAEALADSDVGISRGGLFTESHALETLIGHKPQTLEAAVKLALG